MRVLSLETIHRRGAQLSFTTTLDGYRFTTSSWTEGVDFASLEERYDGETVDRLVFHVAAFEINKLCSLRPEAVDFGPWAPRFQTAAFEDLWLTVADRVWAQWRWENDLPPGTLPRIVSPRSTAPARPISIGAAEVEVLAFCGGGKDSLVAAKLLEDAGVPFASFVYLSSIYGSHRYQDRLIGRLLEHLSPERVHRQWIHEDFLASPVLELGPDSGIRTLCAAETPASLFAALPLALAGRTRHLVVAHERSADRGNGVFESDGREVNHQWGKSTEAEVLLRDYLRAELVTDATWSSVLKPLWDVGIFRLLARYPEAMPATHSCNVEKPWCRRCAKCAYVWLMSLAFLPEDVVRETFGARDLGDDPENAETFRQLLGLAEHTPFECVGLVEEARLATSLATRRGLGGRVLGALAEQIDIEDADAALRRLTGVDPGYDGLPPTLARAVMPRLRERLADSGERSKLPKLG